MEGHIVLDVKPRDKKLKTSEIRAQGDIPVEYYGNGVGNKSLQVDYQDFRRAYKKAGNSMIIVLKVNGKEELNTLVHDVDYNPVTDLIEHIDVINVRMDQEVTAKVPVEFTGIAPAVKELAGIFTNPIGEIEIKCLPKYLIRQIVVDISSLVDFNCYIRVKDIKVPENIVITMGPEEVVATVVAPREEKEEEIVVEEAEGEGEGVEGEEGEAKEGEGKDEEKEKGDE
ncbi:MAG: 50S ribosomal protein L25 [Candidatus Peregrinibacteria bacterium]